MMKRLLSTILGLLLGAFLSVGSAWGMDVAELKPPFRKDATEYWLTVPDIDSAVLIRMKLGQEKKDPDIKNGEANFSYVAPKKEHISLPRGLYFWKKDFDEKNLQRMRNRPGSRAFVWNHAKKMFVDESNENTTWDSARNPVHPYASWNSAWAGISYNPAIAARIAAAAAKEGCPPNSIARRNFFKHVMRGVDEPEFTSPDDWQSDFKHGEFTTHSIQDLRSYMSDQNVAALSKDFKDAARFNIIIYDAEKMYAYRYLTDIGAMQAMPANKGMVFEIASNFHCLEGGQSRKQGNLMVFIGSGAVQGEEGALSAAPGAIWRMYYIPQDKADLLNDDKVTSVISIDEHGRPLINKRLKNKELTQADIDNVILHAKVGFHENMQVSTGCSNIKYMNANLAAGGNSRKDNERDCNELAPDNQTISQLLTAAIDLRSNIQHDVFSQNPGINEKIFTTLARAMHPISSEGMLRSMVVHRKQRGMMTLVGGGAFINELSWVYEGLTGKLMPGGSEKESISKKLFDMRDFIKKAKLQITLMAYRPFSKPEEENDKFDNFIRALKKHFVDDIGGTVYEIVPDGKKLFRGESKGPQELATELFGSPLGNPKPPAGWQGGALAAGASADIPEEPYIGGGPKKFTPTDAEIKRAAARTGVPEEDVRDYVGKNFLGDVINNYQEFEKNVSRFAASYAGGVGGDIKAVAGAGGDVYITLVNGDITEQKFIDPAAAAIVNAANTKIFSIGDAGIAAAIHAAAGKKPNDEYRENFLKANQGSSIELCQTGEARISPSYKISEKQGQAQFIIHGVGPSLAGKEPTNEEKQLLQQTYQSILAVCDDPTNKSYLPFDFKMANNLKITQIALVAISSGIYGYKPPLSAPVALAETLDYLLNKPTNVKEVRFVTFNISGQLPDARARQTDYDVYLGSLKNLMDAGILQKVTNVGLDPILRASSSKKIEGGAKEPQIYKLNTSTSIRDFDSILKIILQPKKSSDTDSLQQSLTTLKQKLIQLAGALTTVKGKG